MPSWWVGEVNGVVLKWWRPWGFKWFCGGYSCKIPGTGDDVSDPRKEVAQAGRAINSLLQFIVIRVLCVNVYYHSSRIFEDVLLRGLEFDTDDECFSLTMNGRDELAEQIVKLRWSLNQNRFIGAFERYRNGGTLPPMANEGVNDILRRY
jgi:hypothetical protein